VLGALLVGCLAVALGLAVCLPWLVEQAVARELSRRGLGNITIGVQAVSWNQATLGPVAVCGEDGVVQAASVVLRYDPARLRHYQVDAVEIVGLHLRLVRRGTTWVPKAQATLRRALDEALRLLPAGSAPAAYPTVELRSSRLELEADGTVMTVPLEGTARLAGVGPSRLQAVAWVCGDPVAAQAVIDLGTGTGTVAVACPRLDLGAWLQTAARAGLPLPAGLPAVAGTVSLRAQAAFAGYALAGLNAAAVVTGLEVPVGPFPLRLRELAVIARSESDLRRLVLTFTADSEGLAFGDQVVAPFRCTGSWKDDALECTTEEIRFRLGGRLDGAARLRLSAEGIANLDTAWVDLGIDVTSLWVASLGGCTGRLRVVGTPEDVWVNGAFDASLTDGAPGLAGVSLDGRVRRGDGTEVDATAVLTVLPAALGAKLGTGVQLSAVAMPLQLTAAVRLPPRGPWSGTGTLRLPAQALTVTAAGLQASAALGLEGRLDADPAGVTLSARLEATALTAELQGAALAADAVTVSLDGLRYAWSAAVATAGAVAAADTPALAGLEVAGRAALRGGTVRLPNGLQCEGISLDLPVAWSATGGLQEHPGQAVGGEPLRTGPIRFGKFAANGFRGRFSQVGPRLRLQGELECSAPAVTIALTQTLEWNPGLSLALHYEVPSLRVQGDEAWYPQMPGLGDLRLTGTLAVTGDLLFDRLGLRAPCRLRLTEGALTWPQQKLTVSGIDADLRLLDLLQMRTAPFQAVRFSAAKIQDVPVDGGQIVFAVDGPESFSLLRCELNWCGGQVHTEAVHLNPRTPELDLVLFAENVDIIRALNLVKGFTAKGSGVLNGKLPISYHSGRLSYASGYLYSVPGQPGHLELQAAGWLTASVPKDHPAYAQLQQAEKALENFRLDAFQLEFTGKQAGTPGAKIRLAGEGANGKVPVTLNLNVNGPIEEALNLGLRLGGM
jgi:hypothetical protein